MLKSASNMVPIIPSFTLHTSFSTLLPLYHSFILDQFGVIHNGSQSLHGAVYCIETMLRENKKLAILSNTSSPSHVALRRLNKYGLKEDMFLGGLVSSGEECARYVREKYCSSSKQDKEAKALWFTWNESEKQSPLEFIQCCEMENAQIGIAESVCEADFILLHGSEVWRRRRDVTDSSSVVQDLNFLYNQDFSIINQILEEASQKKLPMVCANPDLVVTLQGGVIGNMPGKIAQRYEQMGGAVTHFGKPNSRHFKSCLDRLGICHDETNCVTEVAHVGDSLDHDIAGANAVGIDSIFVIGGIHAKDLGLIPTSSDRFGFTILDDDAEQSSCTSVSITKKDLELRLQNLFSERGIHPTHVVPSLSL